MATLKEYYDKDFANYMSTIRKWVIRDKKGIEIEVIGQVYNDYISNTKFISFFIPYIENHMSIFHYLLSKIDELLKFSYSISVIEKNSSGDCEFKSSDYIFSGRIFFYFEGNVNKLEFEKFKNEIKLNNLFLCYRDFTYSVERSKIEKPVAFISYDSRDREIARDIAIKLQTRMCFVWYDEFSLNVGDPLRESIEKGLKECKKCILLLSPNYLSNTGWTKVEFNSIFTREIIEKKNIVLPIWYGIDEKKLLQYSPSLVNKLGIKLEKDNIDSVITKLYNVINK